MKKISKVLSLVLVVVFTIQPSSASIKKKPTSNKVSIPKSKITPTSDLSDVSNCKLKDPKNSNNVYQHMGFSEINDNILNKENIIVQVIPVNFQDFKDATIPRKNLEKYVNDSTNFFSRSSNGKIKLKWLIPNQYIELPKPISEYPLLSFGSRKNNGSEFMGDVIEFSKTEINLDTADFVVIALPSKTTRDQSDFSPAVYLPRETVNPTTKDKIYRTTMIGGDIRVNESSMMLVHEFGHLLGLKDYYNFSWNPQDRYELQFKYLGLFSLMNFPSAAPELLAWDKWILDFISDEQVRCVVKSSTTTHLIAPVSRKTNLVQAIVIPISEFEAIVVESRSPEGNDLGLAEYNKKGGVLVYKINTLTESGKGPAEIVLKYGTKDAMYSDSLLQINEEVTFRGITIKNIESGSFGNVVQIKKP